MTFSACATGNSHPCQEAGEPARDAPFRGNRVCSQKRGPDGRYLNHGLYREWFPDGQIALEGFYKMGQKDGKWTEYNVYGRKVSEKFYEDGVEVEKPKR